MTRKIEVVQTLDDRDVIQAYERQLRLLDRIDRRFNEMGESSEQTSSRTVAGFAQVQVAIGLVREGLEFWKQANREIIEQSDEIAIRQDEAARRFRVQAGLTALEAGPLEQQRRDIGAALALGPEVVDPAATQLVSSGFSPQQASGAELQTFLEILQASNAAGAEADPTALAKALPLFLSANELDLNQQNLERVGIGTQRLFKSTNLQLGDLPEFAKVGSVLQGKLSVEEQLATAATLSQRFPAAESATALRNFTLFLGADAENPTRARALDELGVNPENVDFTGEGFLDVLDTLGGALEQQPEARRDDLLKQLFGVRAVAVGQSIIQNRQEIRRNVDRQRDVAGFQSDVDIATSGLAAGAARVNAARDLEVAERSQGDQLYEQEIERQHLAAGQPAFDAALGVREFRTLRALGLSPHQALSVQDFFTAGEVVTAESVEGAVRQAQAPASAQPRVLENIERNTRQRDATAPPPEQALSRGVAP